MAVSGLVVTLSDDSAQSEAALKVIAQDPRLTVGERFGACLAVIAETPGPREDRDLCESLSATAGVRRVDVAFVALDDPKTQAGDPSDAHRNPS